MEFTPIVALLCVVLFAGASFFFALAETALFSLTKWQIRQLAERASDRGRRVAQLLSEPQDVLATMVLGNTFATAAMLATALWMALNGEWPLMATTLALLGIVLFVCEVWPKTLAVRHAEQWALRAAMPLQWLQRLTRPLRLVAQQLNAAILRAAVPPSFKPQTALTDEDYQELLELAYQRGELAQSERDTILQIIRLDRRTVKEVMRPRSRMAALSDECSIEEMIAAARKYRRRRIPIYDENPDTIVGVLNTRTLLLDPNVDIADAIEFPSFVPESMNLLQLLKSLQRQQRRMAIVLNEFGGTAGVVTVEDILSELVGGFRGRAASEGFVMEKLARGRWRVNGTMRLEDFRREYPALGDVADVETMGGLIMSLMDVVPGIGETVEFRGLKFTVQNAEERRVREILVETK